MIVTGEEIGAVSAVYSGGTAIMWFGSARMDPLPAAR
jgi:hypothetical protein